MVETERTNAALQLVERLNAGYMPSSLIDIESSILTDERRYTDPLIKSNIDNPGIPLHRERVAAEDAIANILTWGFHFRAWSEYPKFYESDEQQAPEIMTEVRMWLQGLKFHQKAIVSGALADIHGWSRAKFWTDQSGKLHSYIFSENECPPEGVVPDAMGLPATYYISRRRRIPFNRFRGIQMDQFFNFYLQKAETIGICRGDEEYTMGFGMSRLEPIWDAITKLREVSDANHFRTQIFPIAIVPPSWNDDSVAAFFEKVSKMSRSTALVTKAGKDTAGKLYSDIPNFQWVSPAGNAPAKTSSSSAGVFSDLSSEWVRLCTDTHHSIRYFVGNPGGALAAAESDVDQDVETDIEEFNHFCRDFIKDFLIYCQTVLGAPISIPPYFTIKSHWQWKRDEKLNQQMMQEQQQFDLQSQYVQSKGSSMGQSIAPKLNAAIQERLDYCVRHNLNMPMSAVSSSTVKGVGLYGQKLLVEFHNPTKGGISKYAYDIGSDEAAQAEWSDMMQSTSKGGFVWDRLRGDKLGQAWGSDYMTPGGTSASIRPYEPYTRNPVGFFGAGDRAGFEQQAAGLQAEKIEAIGTDRYAYPEERGFERGTPSDFYTEPEMFGGHASSSLPNPADIGAAIKTAGQKPPNTSDQPMPDATGGTFYNEPENVSGQTPKKEAYGATFIYGPTGTPQGYAQRPKGMKTKTEATTGGMQPDNTMDAAMPNVFDLVSSKVKKANSLLDLSPKQFNEVAKDLYGVTHSEHTVEKVKALIRYNEELANKHQYRVNSAQLFSGKPMDFNIPLYYRQPDGSISVERACKKAWKTNVTGKKGKVQIYHLNHQFDVGDVEFGWDEQTDEPTMQALFDKTEVAKIMERENMQQTRLYKLIKSDAPIPVSTEYYTDLKVHNGVKYQIAYEDVHLALVDQGNCPDDKCNLK